MKLLSWNIQQGGGKRTDRIVEAISSHDADVVAISEYRSTSGMELCKKLEDKGWKYMESTTSTGRDNGLCLVSRTPLLRKSNSAVPPEHALRWLDADLPSYGFGIGVLHIPGATSKFDEQHGAAKSRFWDAVLATARSRCDVPFVFIGDLNTGASIDGMGFACREHFSRMTGELGWTDLWRAFHTNANTTEYSWYSKRKGGADRNGFRLDHAFASPALRHRVVDCRYSHVERTAGISDHSVLVVEIADL